MRAAAQRTARDPRRGFTIIELVIVLTIISIILGLAVPIYQKSLIRARETVLKNNLFTMRTVIDEYTYDKQKAPQDLRDLVDAGYLRSIPIDPMTGRNDTWRTEMEDALGSVNQSEPGIANVRSGSNDRSLEGTAYSEW
ncbi:MAG: type II secretion system protein [Bryobacter sp.]|nr:type II secretion system protein [Bryobacter sp.]